MATTGNIFLKELLDKIANNDTIEAKRVLSQGIIDANAVDEHGMSLLQHAAYKGNKEMVQLLLDQGADVNGGNHEHQYTALHFGALSGKTEVCHILLNYGAKVFAINSVGRTPAQMAGFVGNHACVALINNFINKSEIDLYTKVNGLEKEPKLHPMLVEPLHQLITGVNLHPVKVAINVKKYSPLYEYLDSIRKVLELMSERQMQLGMETNEIMSFKLHYFSRIVEEIAKIKKNQENQQEYKPADSGDKIESEEGSKKSDAVEVFIKKMLRVDRNNDTPEQNKFLKDCVRSFHARDCAIFRQMISVLVRADAPNPLSVITSSVNGQRAFAECNTECWTCGEDDATKKCSKCKDIRYCDRECQRLHWFVHKKQCNRVVTPVDVKKKVDHIAVQSAVESVRSQLTATQIN